VLNSSVRNDYCDKGTILNKIAHCYFAIAENKTVRNEQFGELDPQATVANFDTKEKTLFQNFRKYLYTLWQIGVETLSETVSVLRRVCQDAVELHLNMLSRDTLIVLGITIPLHYISIPLNKPIHQLFYASGNHMNVHQSPRWLLKLGLKGFKYIRWMVIAGSIWHPDNKLRALHLMIVEGSSFLSITKRIIKNLMNSYMRDTAIRPPNQFFDPKKAFYGGNPSGHICQNAFGLTIIGTQLGYHTFAALLTQTLIACIVSISSNRHYLTQVIDGAALGIIYGLAARKNIAKWEKVLENGMIKNRFQFAHFQIPREFSTVQNFLLKSPDDKQLNSCT